MSAEQRAKADPNEVIIALYMGGHKHGIKVTIPSSEAGQRKFADKLGQIVRSTVLQHYELGDPENATAVTA